MKAVYFLPLGTDVEGAFFDLRFFLLRRGRVEKGIMNSMACIYCYNGKNGQDCLFSDRL